MKNGYCDTQTTTPVCFDPYILSGNDCVPCPSKKFFKNVLGQKSCSNCDTSCQECSGGTNSDCTVCIANYTPSSNTVPT